MILGPRELFADHISSDAKFYVRDRRQRRRTSTVLVVVKAHDYYFCSSLVLTGTLLYISALKKPLGSIVREAKPETRSRFNAKPEWKELRRTWLLRENNSVTSMGVVKVCEQLRQRKSTEISWHSSEVSFVRAWEMNALERSTVTSSAELSRLRRGREQPREPQRMKIFY